MEILPGLYQVSEQSWLKWTILDFKVFFFHFLFFLFISENINNLSSTAFTVGYRLSSDTRLQVERIWLLIDNPVTSCLTLIQTLWLNLVCSHIFTLSLGGHAALVREFLWVMSRCASLSYLLRHVARVTCPIVMHSASVDLLKTLCVHLCEHRL